MTGSPRAVDPERLERWVIRAIGGHPVDHPLDAGIDGMIATTADHTARQVRMLVAVKGGSGHHPRMVGDLAHAVDTLDADGGVLICGSAPAPEVYEAAASSRSSSRRGAALPFVQILTVAEVLSGRRPRCAVA